MYSLSSKLLFFDFPIGDIFNFSSLAYYAVAILFFMIAKWTYNLSTPYKLDKSLLQDDNKAIAIAFAGYLLAASIIIAGVLDEPTALTEKSEHSLLQDFYESLVWISIGFTLLLISGKINDKFIMPFISNKLEMTRDHNVGVGACMLASYVSSAIIIRSLITGQEISRNILLDIAFLIVYYFVAQLALIVFAKLYRITSKYNVDKEIEKDNVAAGISLGFHCIAISLMLSHVLSMSFSIVLFFLYFVNGTVFLLLTRWIFDHFLFGSTSIAKEITQDQNWGIAVIEGVVVIGIALILNTVFHPTLLG